MLYSCFRFGVRQMKAFGYEEMIAIVLEVYFVEVLFRRKFKQETMMTGGKIGVR